ncbi:tRNA (cytidine(56)-2'-O)-methyltransferase [Thermococcus thioreducens]|uniref:tRNA (cytidine(56)-2'-O)-methyltransferase n=1 Tax=Thermococcus thioreducens TaxID=277988 RepID=A0A0Q2ULD9_9EURY|nr:tRNA (cytidine(56)-2'-O)-methyltransferase [Thermococcus thioreducens]ASJ13000.1 tRNA (cytidine(56)-2'-O)-methyltransferase [Thermococcus thioreducens]KQH81456.1 tRNA 2'-O-methylase [Thermococcus thioreducens]SEV82464.1 tRNA (cytidine56-2'-O)-methyltransferase [Thermococcus thioreducens]
MIAVLRLGHRPERDKRITTHVALTARAFGADKIIIAAEEDEHVRESVEDVVRRWGGPFEIEFNPSWKRIMREWKEKGIIVHLTMYGVHIDDAVPRIKSELKDDRDVLIVVGAEKVPREVYDISDYNVGVGNQPHSEVAALAVFLDRLLEGEGLRKSFENAKLRIIPQEKGKKVIELE